MPPSTKSDVDSRPLQLLIRDLAERGDLSFLDALNLVVKAPLVLLNADIVVFYPYNQDSKKFWMPPFVRGSLRHKDRIISEGSVSVAFQQFIDEGKLQFLKDTSRIETTLFNTLYKREHIKSSVVIPLISEGESFGILNIDFRTMRKFGESEVNAIKNYSEQFAANLLQARKGKLLQPYLGFREFANASKNLCKSLASLDPSLYQDLLNTIIYSLQNFPVEVYEDDELISIFDDLVDDDMPLVSVIEETWVNFLLNLGFVHLRRSRLLRKRESVERAIHISQLVNKIITQENNTRQWVLLNVLAGDSNIILSSFSETPEDSIEVALAYYHKALDLTKRDEEPYTWINVSHRLADAYSQKTTGDKAENLKRTSDLFGKIHRTYEQIGDMDGLRRFGNIYLNLLANNKIDDQYAESALSFYRHGLEIFQNLGQEQLAEEFSKKIKELKTVNFTAYYPRITTPERKNSLIVYTHLPELINNVSADAQNFSEELGDRMPIPRRARSDVILKRDTTVTIIPECNELEFNPPSITMKWNGSWNRFLFAFELNHDQVGEVLVVRISVQLAGFEIASIRNCSIEVLNSQQFSETKSGSQTSSPYDKIFISYSRRDHKITKMYKLVQIAYGNEPFIDVDGLRSGENWQEGLARAIDEADAFQLFWSKNSANSDYCRYEWNYALDSRCPDNNCEGFIRPVYWEKPMPNPPPELRHVNFKYVPF